KLEFFNLEDLVKDILETTGYVRELESSDAEDAEDRIENIDELISKAAAYDESHEESILSEFLEEVALVADIDQVSDDNNKVLLMTLHSAKGLEFPHVYLAGLEDGVFPSYMTITADDPLEIEEERRLAYVGITRAKDDLTITCARQRMIRGETQYNPVSRFVKEIPPLLLDHKLPKPRIREYDDYADGEDGYSRSGKSWESRYDRDSMAAESGYSRSGAGSYQRQFGKDADAIFDKPKAVARPKAVAVPKRTAYENQPYITRTTAKIAEQAAASGGSLGYEQGDRVRHLKYGEGTVMKIESGARDYQVTVVFDEVGQKVMYAGFAKLKKV
ncbi:MAG: ATP-binding domain-containing protein, partial [Lachnospiraceae bacterium]|nr:ATP-binding domain-containing protein [Lachnospiraceae bacterium]